MWHWQKIKPNTNTFFALVLLILNFVSVAQTFGKFVDFPPIDAYSLYKGCFVIENQEFNNISNGSDKYIDSILLQQTGKLISLNKDSFEINWQSVFGGEIVSNLLVNNSSIFFVNGAENSFNEAVNKFPLRSVDKLTGLTIWQSEIEIGVIDNKANDTKFFLFEYKENIIVVVENGAIYFLSKQDGKVIWNHQVRSSILTEPILAGEDIIFGVKGNEINFFSIENQQINKKTSIGTLPTFIMIDHIANNLIIGDHKGSVVIRNIQNNEILGKFRAGGAVSKIKIIKQGILVTSLDNFVYLISVENGDLIWKKRLNGRISADPIVFQDYLFVNSIESNEIFILKVDNGKVFNKIILPFDDFLLDKASMSGDSVLYLTRRGLFRVSANNNFCSKENQKPE